MKLYYFLLFLLFIPAIVFAEEYEVRILKDSVNPECAIRDTCLSPSKLTVLKGDTITWIPELVDESYFISSRTDGQLNWIAGNYVQTFDRVGTFNYKISDPPWINGTITVEYSQQQNEILNYIDILSVKKIQKIFYFEIEGHSNTDGGIVRIFTDKNRNLADVSVYPDKDGYFYRMWADTDGSFRSWKDGTYRIEFSSGSDNSNIIEKTFDLNSPSKLKLNIYKDTKIPFWVKNLFIAYSNTEISEDELLYALQYLIKQGIIEI